MKKKKKKIKVRKHKRRLKSGNATIVKRHYRKLNRDFNVKIKTSSKEHRFIGKKCKVKNQPFYEKLGIGNVNELIECESYHLKKLKESPEIISKRNKRYSNRPIPITICSFRKANVDKALPAELYTCTRLKGFDNWVDDYIILSRKYGLMFNDEEYEQYEDYEMLDDVSLLKLLKKQKEDYPNLDLYFYHPRPLLSEKWFQLMEDAGFKIKTFQKLEEFLW